MSKYIHKVNYYETDKMGITHHSNYIRFMEEARMNFMAEIGCPMTKIEKKGISSPVISINCEYINQTVDRTTVCIKVNGLFLFPKSKFKEVWQPYLFTYYLTHLSAQAAMRKLLKHSAV